MKKIKVLFIGDIYGKIGRKLLIEQLPKIKSELKVDFVIANNENATHGHGCSLQDYKALSVSGINCFTSGNHFLGHKDVKVLSKDFENQLRPANFPPNYVCEFTKVFNINGIEIRVSNIMGNAFINLALDNCFTTFDQKLRFSYPAIHILDFHGEATGEKRSFAEKNSPYLSAVIGTHTHVQTADEQILNGRTAFISDVGAISAVDSVLGADKNAMIARNAYSMNVPVINIESGLCKFCAVVMEFDPCSGKAISIKRINQEYDVK